MVMGIGTGTGTKSGVIRTVPTLRKYEDSKVRRYEIMNPDGTVAGSFTVRKSSGSSKQLKKVQYNFKRISAQILKSKTSYGAKTAVSSARRQVAQLKRKLRSNEYDDKELEIAIAHAEKIERVARKRMKHLQEEERAKKGGICEGELEDKEELDMEEAVREMEASMEENMDELMESMDEMLEETGLDELAEELTGGVKPDMDPEDLEELKRKHRLDEMKEIAEADSKYLKALFNKLESDRQSVASNMAMSGVSLELGGMEMAVHEPAPVPVTEGTAVDVSV